jgi:hypothetical protein
MPYCRAALKCSSSPYYRVALDPLDGNQRDTILADTFDLFVAPGRSATADKGKLIAIPDCFSNRAASDGTIAACKHFSGWYDCCAHAPFKDATIAACRHLSG